MQTIRNAPFQQDACDASLLRDAGYRCRATDACLVVCPVQAPALGPAHLSRPHRRMTIDPQNMLLSRGGLSKYSTARGSRQTGWNGPEACPT
jgi:hypothetical protein